MIRQKKESNELKSKTCGLCLWIFGCSIFWYPQEGAGTARSCHLLIVAGTEFILTLIKSVLERLCSET